MKYIVGNTKPVVFFFHHNLFLSKITNSEETYTFAFAHRSS